MKTRVTLLIGLFYIFAPPSAVAESGTSTTRHSSTQATITYTGNDGTVEYNWILPAPGSQNSLGTVSIRPHFGTLSQPEIILSPTLTPTQSESALDGALVFRSAQWADGTSTPTWTLTYETTTHALLSVTLQFNLNGKLLKVECTALQPSVGAIDLGPWPAISSPRSVPIPYYPGNPPVYLQTPRLFAVSGFDWHTSNATSVSDTGVQAIYQPLTNGNFNLLHECILIGVAPSLPDLFPQVGAEPSPYMQTLAGKTVLDVWANSFDDVTLAIQRLAGYGLNNCVLLMHNWQSMGFDNGLPYQYPANPLLGGDQELNRLVATTHNSGCLFALHENYADYYPNYPAFNSADILLSSRKTYVPTWLNQYTGLQAFATKPSQYVTQASQQSPLIRRAYNTDSAFIDVNSSTTPWYRADMDPATPNAGTYSAYAAANKRLWQYARSIYQGPVFGEGKHHAFWSGQLDGVEAQFGSGGVFEGSGRWAPLAVDFDLQQIHSLQVNHGMGYYDRWVAPGDDIHDSLVLDAYRMQQMIFGHAPFLGADLWSNPARLLIEQNLAGPVASRIGAAQATSIRYLVNGHWTDLSTALRTSILDSVQVRYSNGDVLVANGTTKNLSFQGYTLPPYGWFASGSGLLAYTALQDGVVSDYSETLSHIFANARNQSDLSVSMAFGRPSIERFAISQGQLTADMRMQVFDDAPVDQYITFVHFVNARSDSPEGIVFQCDHKAAYTGGDWKPGALLGDSFQCFLPSGLADGQYSVRVGLYSERTGARLSMAGMLDATGRVIMGVLTISAGGSTATFAPQTPPSSTPDPRLNAFGRVVNFGPVRTDGMVTLDADAGQWTIRAYPRYRDVTVQVQRSRVPPPSNTAFSCDSALAPPKVEVVDGGYWQIHLNGAKSCRW